MNFTHKKTCIHTHILYIPFQGYYRLFKNNLEDSVSIGADTDFIKWIGYEVADPCYIWFLCQNHHLNSVFLLSVTFTQSQSSTNSIFSTTHPWSYLT